MEKDLVDYTKLKSDNGHYLTQGLFYEYRHHTKLPYIPYTLRERDYKGYLSMYRIYMECDTEYEAAQVLLNSWEHWCRLCDSGFLSTPKIYCSHSVKWPHCRTGYRVML